MVTRKRNAEDSSFESSRKKKGILAGRTERSEEQRNQLIDSLDEIGH